jgi:acetyl-CoA synthetase
MPSNAIESLSHEQRHFSPQEKFQKNAWIKDIKEYERLYQESIQDPEKFWAGIAENFTWYQTWNKVCSYDWEKEISIKWFEGAQTNITVNCLDRHIPEAKDRPAFIWIGNNPGEERRISYGELLEEVCQFANALKELKVKKGDRVAIYMPMIPELPIALLACARIGAVHSVIFGGFSAESLKDRIIDAECSALITSDGGYRGAKTIPIKKIADEALALCEHSGHQVQHSIVVKRTGESITMQEGRDLWWHELTKGQSSECKPEEMDAEDPLFVLYTSGSTGKPKGVLHTTAGYMVYTATTFKYVFDYHAEDLFWCTADIGWITGHSYMVYGPLCNQAMSVLFEGVPNHPEPDRFWDIIEKYRVNIFYTAPTAIRALMREGDDWIKKHDLSSIRLLGTVGEPINPQAWIWYHDVVGQENCPVIDTWWQTETGGILITPLAGAMTLKPGSASRPFFGVEPAILRDDGTECEVNEGGKLVIKKPWPGIMRTVYGQHERFKETYFSQYPGAFFTGDGARIDDEGDYWLLGRIDDVLNVSGHRIGTAEVESALVSHASVAEAAVVGFPHDIKGQGIHAYVTVIGGTESTDLLRQELIQHVRKEIGPTATPDRIQFAPSLPKTRSGKIMRRILRKIAEGETDNLGDTTTLADPSVVAQLITVPES